MALTHLTRAGCALFKSEANETVGLIDQVRNKILGIAGGVAEETISFEHERNLLNSKIENLCGDINLDAMTAQEKDTINTLKAAVTAISICVPLTIPIGMAVTGIFDIFFRMVQTEGSKTIGALEYDHYKANQNTITRNNTY